MKTVADGYATNFLIPQQLAVPGRRRRLPRLAARHREPRGQARSASATMPRSRRPGSRSTTLTMGVKVGEGGKLYGSITTKDIADALARRGIEVDRHKIDLEEPLKSLGHVQGRDQGLLGHDARGHDRRRAEGLIRPSGARGPVSATISAVDGRRRHRRGEWSPMTPSPSTGTASTR